jgi:hypothetical protein
MGYLSDSKRNLQFTVVARQAMGTSSPKSGAIEHMMHRNLLQDDGRGLGERNNDGSAISVQVYLLVQPIEPSVRIARRLSLSLQHYPRIMYGEAPSGRTVWTNTYKPNFEPLTEQLPTNLHIVSFKARDSHSDDIILRFLHIFEDSQHSRLSKPAVVKFDKLFKNWETISTRERSLAITMDVDFAKQRRPTFLPSTDVLTHVSGLPPDFAKQNTEEEGVFLSKAALDDLEKQKQQEQQNTANKEPNGRNLLSLPDNDLTREASSLNLLSQPDPDPIREAMGRKLLALPDDMGLALSPLDIASSTYMLHPMEIKSFLTHITVKKPPPPSTKPPTRSPKPNSKVTQKTTSDTIQTTGSGKITASSTRATSPAQATASSGSTKTPAVHPPPRITPPPEYDYSTTGFLFSDDESSDSNDEVSVNEVTALLVMSLVCTGLLVLAYTRLRRSRSSARKEVAATKRKDFVSLV